MSLPSDEHESAGPLLTLYTRSECGLCDLMKVALGVVRREVPLEWVEQDVEDDSALEAAYGTRLPVLMLGERLVAEGRAGSREILDALQALGVR